MFYYLEAILFTFSVSIDLTPFLQPNSMSYSDLCLFSTVDVTFSAQNLKYSALSMETYLIFWSLWRFLTVCLAPWGREIYWLYWILGYTVLLSRVVSPLQLLKRLLAWKIDMRTKLDSSLRSHCPSGIVITIYHLVCTAFQCTSICTPASLLTDWHLYASVLPRCMY
jgi:hypothetical protein